MVCQTDLNSVVLMQAEEGARWWGGGGISAAASFRDQKRAPPANETECVKALT